MAKSKSKLKLPTTNESTITDKQVLRAAANFIDNELFYLMDEDSGGRKSEDEMYALAYIATRLAKMAEDSK